MSFPLQAVDRLFARLTATYGRQFLSLYEGLDTAAVKTSWCHELAGFADRLEDVAWALENLPEQVPNAIAFRNLCRKAPAREAARLPAPPADPARVRAELAKLRPMAQAARKGGGINLDWARRIVAKADAGVKVNMLPLKMAREALGRRGLAHQQGAH